MHYIHYRYTHYTAYNYVCTYMYMYMYIYMHMYMYIYPQWLHSLAHIICTYIMHFHMERCYHKDTCSLLIVTAPFNTYICAITKIVY